MRCALDWGQVTGDPSPSAPAGRSALELDVDVANHVVRQVVAHVQVLDLAVLVHLLKDVLVEVLGMAAAVYCMSAQTGSSAPPSGAFTRHRGSTYAVCRRPESCGSFPASPTREVEHHSWTTSTWHNLLSSHLEVLLGLACVHGHGQAIRTWGRVECGILVQVGQQQRGADGGPVVQSRAAIAMPACPAAQPVSQSSMTVQMLSAGGTPKWDGKIRPRCCAPLEAQPVAPLRSRSRMRVRAYHTLTGHPAHAQHI